MRNKYISLILLLLIRIAPLYAQEQPTPIKELKVGDKCPDFIFKEIINFNKTNARLSDYKGKLVIIDFFATWCGPCIEALPTMDSLQQHFGDKIVILPVTREAKEKVITLINANQIYKNLKLPFITSNVELDNYFPHRTIPHEVWIDQNGIVKSITSDLEVTEKNIQKVLDEKSLAVEQKFEIKGEDFNKPFLGGGIGKDYTLDNKAIKYSALITGYIDGSAMQNKTNLGNGKVLKMGYAKLIAVNSLMEVLYRQAFVISHPTSKVIDNPDLLFHNANRTLWEAKDTTFYSNYGKNKSIFNKEIYRTKSFSYEFITPVEDSAQIAKFAVQELNNYFGRKFGIEAVKEERNVLCWVLRKTSAYTTMTTKGNKLAYDFDQVNYNKLHTSNSKINFFLFIYNGFFLPMLKMPIVDETGIKENVDFDLEINADMRNFDSINKALLKYGLEFIKARRKVEMIVIRDKKNI